MPSDCGAFTIFADLDEGTRSTLEAAGRQRTFSAGEVIALEGERDAPVAFVVSGAIRAYRTSADGREQTVANLGPGSAFYMPAAFSADPSAPATTEAVKDSRVLLFEQQAFRRVVSENPTVALAVLRDLSDKLRHLVGLAHELGLLNVRARLAAFLLRQQEGADEGARWTHERIAASIGSVREVVSRGLKGLARDGVIRLDRQRVEVVDREALEQIAEGL